MSTRDPVLGTLTLPGGLQIPPEDWDATPVSVRAAVIALAAAVQQLAEEVRDLRERLGTDSSNSSKPPSSDPPSSAARRRKAAKGKKRKKGGQPGHRGASRKLVPTGEVDEVKKFFPGPCGCCGGEVTLGAEPVGRRQVVELPQIKPIITEFHIYEGRCSSCGRGHVAEFPPEASQGMLGPRAMATVATLTGQYHLSKRAAAAAMTAMFGLEVSAATISATETRVADVLDSIYEEAKSGIQQAPVANADETGWKSGTARKRCYLWAVVAPLLTVFALRWSRASAVAKELLGTVPLGIYGTDRYSGYAWIPLEQRQICWAHVIRDFRKLLDRGGDSAMIASLLLAWIPDIFRAWHEFLDGKTTRAELQKQIEPARTAIQALLQMGADCDHPKTAGTCAKLLEVEPALWTFAKLDNVEPTNNAAERAVRPAVLWRRKSFGTDASGGERYVERILTVVASCKQQGRDVCTFIETAIVKNQQLLPLPSLLPEQP